jgi:hypothetical protein
MDILNFISWIKGSKLVKTVDPTKTLVPLGVKTSRRDDDYTPVTMTVEDLLALAGGGLQGESYITVLGNNPDPALNGAELKAAYDIAAASTPYGNPRSNSNTYTIIIAPGIYDMGAYESAYGWQLNAPYVNLRGLTANYDADRRTDVQISTFCANGEWCEYTGLDTTTYFNGQILIGEQGMSTSSFTNCHAGPYSFGTGTLGTFGLSCNFKDCSAGANSFGSSMTDMVSFPYKTPPGANSAASIQVSGSFKNCIAQGNSFGASLSGDVSILGANFTDCTVINNGYAFGASIQGDVNIVIAEFTNCLINNQAGFGVSEFGSVTLEGSIFTKCSTYGRSFGCGGGPNASVAIDYCRFYDCVASNGPSPGFSFGAASDSVNGGVIITSSSIFENCEAGYISFGSSAANVDIYGQFNNCRALGYSFGHNPNTYNARAGGTFRNCTVTLGFGGPNAGGFGNIASGTFIDCQVLGNAGQEVFGYGSASNPAWYGTASGSFYNCVSTVFAGSFGVNATGTFINCVATTYAFGSNEADGYFSNCSAADFSFGAKPASLLNGTFINCYGSTNSFGNNDTTLLSSLFGKAYYCVKRSGEFFPSIAGTKALLCIEAQSNTIKSV